MIHRWRHTGDYFNKRKASVGIFVCKRCGIRVDTTAGFPSYGITELWNGVRIPKLEKRPSCEPPEQANASN